ncbi:hypothetical protein E2562_029331 [Oryza meyeriana var. granulata]|uniref:Uncharacterized protein n=1 Tax=Oryza meyeriana var. granulata TaxID=110450 RepID=A0A6G1E4P1_9ORYZ|nr:hypothetical protein E2562_029331 [Oryza meyeriana var. granulata]
MGDSPSTALEVQMGVLSSNCPSPPPLISFMEVVATTVAPSILGAHPASRRRHPRQMPNSPPRRSLRLSKKNEGGYIHSMTKAQHVAMKQLGVVDDENRVGNNDVLCYLELFKTPLSAAHIQALGALCNLFASVETLQAA